ncbi:hypothetical protein [Singulisphaera sp. PoT]|uniref:hypothetical protein n=1 Tax=Singulisphaera sp. PoT TaxID=3411797 RepID=UPI003BF5C8A0
MLPVRHSRAADPPSLPDQLARLGRQATAQGESEQALKFYRKALSLDPHHAESIRAIERYEHAGRIKRASQASTKLQPTPDSMETSPTDPQRPQANIEEAERLEAIQRQQLTADVRQRLQTARDLVASGQPEAALNTLRLEQTVIRSSTDVPDDVRDSLDREIQAQLISTVRAEEQIVQDRAEKLRLEAAAEQQVRALDLLTRNHDTVSTMMIQFDSLMAQGQYNVLFNGGTGDIVATTAPFYEARLLAQKAHALVPNDPTPHVGAFVASTTGFLAQEMAYEQLKEFRFMLSMQDAERAAVPFPDTITIEYPDAEHWRTLSEKRIKRYGKAVDLLDRDPKTKNIIEKLNEPITMSFPNETPFEEVLKYIKTATTGANDSGIPIYVDPVGLQEAEKTMSSPVTLDLEGVPLKTTLRLILKQLTLTYTVKDGMITITSENAEDTPTEIRVYPVADLAIIPISLISGGGGGMGGMGGGMGGMGGGMGGMGGGMGGMGGGMGGMGGMGGGMGGMGMMSIPPRPSNITDEINP